MSRVCLALALAAFVRLASAAENLSPYTFRIKATGCRTTDSHPVHILTGFRLSKQVGIVTALHGVVGCAEIWAANTYGLNLPDKLQIAAVDLDHDLALLKSTKLSQLPPGGLDCRCVSTPCAAAPNFCGAPTSATPSDLRVEGMPRGNKGLGAWVQADYPFLGQLDAILGDKYWGKASNRNSPSLSIQVARISGFEPGDSGGPVLNEKSEVIAVADGGLEDGGSKVGWAIPYQDVHWTPTLSLTGLARKRYNDLGDQATDELFAYDDAGTDVGPIVVIDKEDVLKGLRKIMEGTGTVSWDFKLSKDGPIVFTAEETRKFVSLQDCRLTFQNRIESDRSNGVHNESEETVTIDLSDATVQVSTRDDHEFPRYPLGAAIVVLEGTPGFKPFHRVGSSTIANPQMNKSYSYPIDMASNSWALYFTTKDATDIAVSVLNKAIGLCKQGQ